MKASEKLCVKSFFEVLIGRFVESMGYIASHFVGGDIRGYFAGCFSKVEDDVVYYNGADQKKNRSLVECFFFLPLFDFTLMNVYMNTGIK